MEALREEVTVATDLLCEGLRDILRNLKGNGDVNLSIFLANYLPHGTLYLIEVNKINCSFVVLRNHSLKKKNEAEIQQV